MKHFFLSCCVLLSFFGYGQAVSADPALNQINITDNAGNDINEFALPLGGVYTLQVPILNLNALAALPAGSCKVKIGLGSKLVLDPDFSLGNTNTSTFFDWTAAVEGGQVQLTGDLKVNLPAGFNIVLPIRVKGSVLGNSTITTNFLITNHNTATTLSDENPNNNTSFMPYTIVSPIPVDFTSMIARRNGCQINIKFSAENEINVARYEIEASKDGIHYTTIGQLPAIHSIHYQFNFALTAALEAPVLHIRTKSVDWDGKVQYTPVVTVKGSCSGDLAVQLYPNPLPANKTLLTIEAVSGRFNGRANVVLLDAAGRILRNSTATMANAQQLNYETGYLPAGQYLLKIQSMNGDEAPLILRFQKM